MDESRGPIFAVELLPLELEGEAPLDLQDEAALQIVEPEGEPLFFRLGSDYPPYPELEALIEALRARGV